MPTSKVYTAIYRFTMRERERERDIQRERERNRGNFLGMIKEYLN
jgi:hypothetical protein